MPTPSLESFLVEKNDYKLIGGYYKSGVKRASTAILVHGIPGIEKNLDLAYEFQRRGWNCLYFHYRGSWGSTGNYNIDDHVEDISTARNWVTTQEGTDPERLVLVGSSLGGYNTLRAAATIEPFHTYVPISPLIDPLECNFGHAEAAMFSKFLSGADEKQILTQWKRLPAISDMAAQLQDKKILMITGDKDEVFPPSHYSNIMEEVPSIVWERHPESDHVFSGHHNWMIETVFSGLQRL